MFKSDMDKNKFPLEPQKLMRWPPSLLMLCLFYLLPSDSSSICLFGDCVVASILESLSDELRTKNSFSNLSYYSSSACRKLKLSC